MSPSRSGRQPGVPAMIEEEYPMNKLFFRNDYGEGAHPAVLEALVRTNLEHT